MLSLLYEQRAAAPAGGSVTIDLDITDVEVYGRKKREVANSHQGQRVGRMWRSGPKPRSRWPPSWVMVRTISARPP
jgi:hypothetical protein